MADTLEWVQFKEMLRTPCPPTSEAHAERAEKCAEQADLSIAELTGGLMNTPPAVQLAVVHAQVALALKAVGA